MSAVQSGFPLTCAWSLFRMACPSSGGAVRLRSLALAVCGFACTILISPTSEAQAVRYRVVPITSPFPARGPIVGVDMNKSATLPLTRWIGQRRQPFVWKEGTSAPLTLLCGYSGTAWSINSAGHITGGAFPEGKWKYHAYVYRKGETEDLGTFGGTSATGMRLIARIRSQVITSSAARVASFSGIAADGRT